MQALQYINLYPNLDLLTAIHDAKAILKQRYQLKGLSRSPSIADLSAWIYACMNSEWKLIFRSTQDDQYKSWLIKMVSAIMVWY